MLYHLSIENHHNEVFKPRVPHTVVHDLEDETHKRVCFSTTISGAYRGIQFNEGEWAELYVHIPKRKNIKFKRITTNEVFDCKFTNEVWVQRNVKMKCIGKIKAMYKRSKRGRWRPKVIIKWIERYED